jgi:GMP synthase-like glutamine amidotransferase
MKHIAFIDNFINDPINHGVNEIVLRNNILSTYHQPARFGTHSLEALDNQNIDGIILFGSASHVEEKNDWHQFLYDFTMERLKKGSKVLGICFGHQLFAHYHGGKVSYVEENRTHFDVLRTLDFKEALFGFEKGSQVQLPYSHQQAVFKSPSDFRVVASSLNLSFEILKHQEYPLWTCQSHPESSEKFLREKIGLSPDEARQQKQIGNQFIDGFVQEVLKG